MSTFSDIQQILDITENEIGIAWTGQAGFVFKDSDGKIYHTDPYLSNICSQTVGYHRVVPAPVSAAKITADYVFVTHVHKDHLDDDSLPVMAKANPGMKFVAPPSCISRMLELGINYGQLIPIQRGEEKKIGNSMVKAVLALHTDDSVGFVIKFGNLSFYITGDTTYSNELINIKKEQPNVMMPCINGRLGCMNISDAVRLTGHIQPNFVIPMHYGMFKENTANPEEFIRQAEASSGITKGMILKMGHWYSFSDKKGFTLHDI
ncbi:MAG: MBL fold metallo-hydrolase [Balneolaceae bacterium]